jgi:hypothetical protein
MSEQYYYERRLAPLLGISRDDLVYLRGEVLKKKKKGLWRRAGREIVIAESGLALILGRLREASNSAPVDVDFSLALVAAPEKKSPPLLLMERNPIPAAGPAPAAATSSSPEKNGLVELTVHKLYPNARMLRAATPAGELVDVRVKTNRNFVARMTLKARLVCPGKYEMEGRCPRTRGRY